MTLESECQDVLAALQIKKQCLELPLPTTAFHSILSLIDLTLLDENASDASLALLQEKANAYSVAGVCVFPSHLKKLNASLSCQRVTVINFPEGNGSIKTTRLSLEKIVGAFSVDEIDYVFPYQLYLSGQEALALKHCHDVYLFCQRHSLSLKVILETGAFNSPESIYQLSLDVINTGCDFIKTSTGKIPLGATPLAAFSILKAIIDSNKPCGIKISGGIKTLEQANFYSNLAAHMLDRTVTNQWFRIGGSSLLDQLD